LATAVLCRHLVPEGSVHAFLADHRQRLFPDEMFADLFGSGRGRPSVPADVITTVMVLQALEGISDREAVGQLATNIAWKAAAGLAITDEAFHSTVLTLWRNKLRASASPQRIFDAVRAVITESGVLAGKTRRAVDSTVLDDAVARQDTITMLVARFAGPVGWCLACGRSGCASTTSKAQACRLVIGATLPTSTAWSPSWSMAPTN
jgi:hypothetical protein